MTHRNVLTDVGSFDIIGLAIDNNSPKGVIMVKQEEATLRKALAEAETQRDKWTRRSEVLKEWLADYENDGQPANASLESAAMKGMSSTVAAEAALRAVGKPLHIKKLIALMDKGGYPVEDARKLYSTLYTNMVRKDRVFRMLKPATFALVEWGKREE